jgi:hypothetical protein
MASDPCAEVCGANMACAYNRAADECEAECRPGFVELGDACVDDACADVECPPNAKCETTADGCEATCAAGFSEMGDSCVRDPKSEL